MTAHPGPDDIPIEVIGRRICELCQEIGGHAKDLPRSRSALTRIRELIERIPMASEVLGVALARVNNAIRFVDSAEVGSAKYEIRLLRDLLKECLGREGEFADGLNGNLDLLAESTC